MDAQPLNHELSFEEAFERLEAAVSALQDGQLPLERALQYYEEGMKLAQHCNELLQKAELRVQQLGVDELGVPVVQPLELS
jgi:exodeoxyribonuclease VII small subunit